ncbi:unnamed protein product, partial [Symbiodinium microadriaticum]
SAILDKGLLRRLLRLLPEGSSLADFGALDGQYSSWLNDTGWVTAFAFDGVPGVTDITDGRVTEVGPWATEVYPQSPRLYKKQRLRIVFRFI